MLECVIYTRPNCHLCEQMVADLSGYLAARNQQAQLELIDIEADLALVAAHGTRIPVLQINGQEICYGRLDHAALNEMVTVP